jgi:hypothetical protein
MSFPSLKESDLLLQQYNTPMRSPDAGTMPQATKPSTSVSFWLTKRRFEVVERHAVLRPLGASWKRADKRHMAK